MKKAAGVIGPGGCFLGKGICGGSDKLVDPTQTPIIGQARRPDANEKLFIYRIEKNEIFLFQTRAFEKSRRRQEALF